jgi:GNAT superfamily N-acetyltransferase
VAEEWRRGAYTISTDPARIDLALVHDFLTHSYWAEGIPFEVVERSIANSLPFGIYQGARQIGFARVVTDRATFAYIGDVFVLEEFRGRGLSKWLMEVMVRHPELQNLRRWILATADAHGLYRQFGFTELVDPGRYMARLSPDIYKRMAEERAARDV